MKQGDRLKENGNLETRKFTKRLGTYLWLMMIMLLDILYERRNIGNELGENTRKKRNTFLVNVSLMLRFFENHNNNRMILIIIMVLQ